MLIERVHSCILVDMFSPAQLTCNEPYVSRSGDWCFAVFPVFSVLNS